jgi:general secretion pathway protein I
VINGAATAVQVRGHRHRIGLRGASLQRGFSLLEVIAAIMLLAIAFAALMKVAGASISLTQNAAGYTQAALWARGMLDSAFVGEPVRAGNSAGQFNKTYRWRLAVTPWTATGNVLPTAPMHLYQLDLDVLWGPVSRPRSAHFRTLRLAGQTPTGAAQAAP